MNHRERATTRAARWLAVGPRLRARDEVLLERCQGRVVLDVGCVGQDAAPGAPRWLHGRLRAIAALTHGVDTAAEGVARLQAAGFHVFAPEALPPRPEGYERIVMADVIEHVNDPVALLRWAAERLAVSGRILVTTPNPFAFRQLALIVRRGVISVNDEHTCWFDPRTLGEVTRRAGLVLEELEWLDDGAFAGTDCSRTERVVRTVGLAAARFRPYLAGSFLAVLAPRVDP